MLGSAEDKAIIPPRARSDGPRSQHELGYEFAMVAEPAVHIPGHDATDNYWQQTSRSSIDNNYRSQSISTPHRMSHRQLERARTCNAHGRQSINYMQQHRRVANLRQSEEGINVIESHDISDKEWGRIKEPAIKERRVQDSWDAWFNGSEKLNKKGNYTPWMMQDGKWKRKELGQEEHTEEERAKHKLNPFESEGREESEHAE